MSLQTAILEKKLHPLTEETKHLASNTASQDEASSKPSEDPVVPEDCFEKEAQNGGVKEEEEETKVKKRTEVKVSAPDASPGSSTISGVKEGRYQVIFNIVAARAMSN